MKEPRGLDAASFGRIGGVPIEYHDNTFGAGCQ